MADWTSSMTRTFEYHVVDPNTWKDVRQLRNVKSCSITRDSEVDTLGSATIDTTELLDECYVRVYLILIQNGVEEKHPLGTYMIQTPSSSFDGRVKSISMDAYTPLIELKEKCPPFGYSLLKGVNVMDMAYMLTRENLRAPVVKPKCDTDLFYDFVSETSDTWLSFLSDLISNAKFIFSIDEMGRILFSPKQDTASLQPVWTFNDDNSSILQPEVTLEHDLYDVPNVVEVIYSNGSSNYQSVVVNDDPNSPTSTVNRGRRIVRRITDPDLIGDPTENQIDRYARQTLRDLSSLEYSVSFSHGFCPVRVGDCVRLNYTRADLNDIKAKIIRQTIKCTTDCQISTKAVFTKKLWG